MRIGLLSREPHTYSSKRLLTAARQRKHRIRVFDTLKFAIYLEEARPTLHYAGAPAPACDAVIPRIGASVTFFGSAIVRQYEQMGIPCLNSSLGITTSRDKLRALQMLSRHDVGMVTTAFVKRREDVLAAIRAVGGAPLVVKLLEGTHGVGVMLAETDAVAEAVVETIHSTKQNVLIQKFVSESRGRDIRVIVVGGEVVAAMRRVAAGDEFRSNVHRGGQVEAVRHLDPEAARMAIRACQILGLNVAGVDMLETQAGPKIMEVNSSPGLEGIERATGIDVAGAIIASLEAKSTFAEVDLRERLSLDRGYGIAELVIDQRSPLQRMSIRDSALRQQDITVLRITRGKTRISNPKPERELLTGDVLLCFGRLDAMRAILEQSRRAPRRKQGSRSQP